MKQAYLHEGRIRDVFGNEENFYLMQIVALGMHYARAPHHVGTDWRSDPLTFDVMVKTVNGLLEVLRPVGKLPPRTAEEDIRTDFAERMTSAMIWEAVDNADTALPLGKNKITKEQGRLSLIKVGLKPKRPEDDDIVPTAAKRARARIGRIEDWRQRGRRARDAGSKPDASVSKPKGRSK